MRSLTPLPTDAMVSSLFGICCGWVEDNITPAHLLGFIKFGVVYQRENVLDTCTRFIKSDVQDQLLEISQGWVISDDEWGGLIRFLVQKEILQYTIPVLTSRINNDADVALVLTEFRSKGIIALLFAEHYWDLSVVLLEKMIKTVQSRSTNAMLSEVQDLYREKKEKQRENFNTALKSLLGSGYHGFTVETLISCEKDFKLSHFQYVDIVVGWIECNDVTEECLDRLWGTVRHDELRSDYLFYVREAFISSGASEIPEIPDRYPEKYLCREIHFYGRMMQKKPKDWDNGIHPINFSVNHLICEKCENHLSLSFDLNEESPCYTDNKTDSSHEIKHVFANYNFRTRSKPTLLSLLTNNLEGLKAALKQGDLTPAYLSCVYECNYSSMIINNLVYCNTINL